MKARSVSFQIVMWPQMERIARHTALGMRATSLQSEATGLKDLEVVHRDGLLARRQ
jgi:hypothetical protein